MTELAALKYPELVFGLCGPIGVNINLIALRLEEGLRAMKYTPHTIQLTAEMETFSASIGRRSTNNYFELMEYKMDYANWLCQDHSDKSMLARIAVRAIKKKIGINRRRKQDPWFDRIHCSPIQASGRNHHNAGCLWQAICNDFRLWPDRPAQKNLGR